MSDPHAVTRAFESALCEYTGAKFAVTTTSCTQAILMALAWWERLAHEDTPFVRMPRLSYVGVPASIIHAGCVPMFRDHDWQGEYEFEVGSFTLTGELMRYNPIGIWDSARRFTSGMFRPGAMQCVSFHWSKILGLSQGGAILHDNQEADAWLRRARFDGRTEGDRKSVV